MSGLPAINDLFARLATNLQAIEPADRNEDETHDLLISNLNRSLNLGEHRVRVLDTALSLMCITAPQVFDSLTEYLVKTIVTVLSSTINCKALTFPTGSVLQIGSSISSSDCTDVIDACADVLGKLKGHGTLSSSLLYAVLQMVVSTSRYQHVLTTTPILAVKSVKKVGSALHKLVCHLPREISLKSQQIPSRLLFWYVDPLILKDNVSKILKEAIGRHFICLNTEFYEQIEWRSVIICLAISPVMFIETRGLLHNWFLATGLASVLEFQSELTSNILDVISRPVQWGLSAELGSKLPFSYAYFPYNHQLLKTLCRPFSREGFLYLVDSINKTTSQDKTRLTPAEMKISSVDHKSMWAMAMNFPDWFYYASVLLFSNSSNFKCGLASLENDDSAAARYIAWILNPVSESDQCYLANCLNKISRSFSLNSDKNKKPTIAFKKKLKKPKSCYKEDCRFNGCDAIRLWLEDFQGIHMTSCNRKIQTNTSNGFDIKRNVLLRRIPLGILIGFCEEIDKEGCEVILHYAAIGKILQKKSSMLTEICEEKEAVEGARTVFNLTDLVERMSDSIFETEESRVVFICRVKLRVGDYLIKCLMKLLDLQIAKDHQFVMLSDLHNRLIRWKGQGKDVFIGKKEFDDAVYALRSKFSSL